MHNIKLCKALSLSLFFARDKCSIMTNLLPKPANDIFVISILLKFSRISFENITPSRA